MNNRRTKSLIIAAIVLVIGLIIGLVAANYGRRQKQTPAEPVRTISATTNAEPQGVQPPPPGCPTKPAIVDNPTQFEVMGKDQNFKMMSLGTDGDAAAAPPPNEGYTVAWWNQGPKVGSTEGKVVLSSHTFQFGGALGNDLQNGAWEVGQVIKISDNAGNSACYRYSSNLHVLNAEYDPESDVLYDWTDPNPRFALVVCSDYTLRGETLGRILYYADLIQ